MTPTYDSHESPDMEFLEIRISALRGALRRVLVFLDYLDDLGGAPPSAAALGLEIAKVLDETT